VERKKFQSLRRHMAKLREEGTQKGIVDPKETAVGTSSEGKPLEALKLGKGSKHKVLFTGCHHAQEWISVEVPFLTAKYLIEGYTDHPGDDPEKKRIKHLVDNREIWFVPMVNPDGHDYSVKTNRKWRANRGEHELQESTFTATNVWGGSRVIHVKKDVYTGVDLNRNYPTKDWGVETQHSSCDPADCEKGTWVGPFRNSEKETQAMVELLNRGFRASMTYHSYDQLLLYTFAAKEHAFTLDVGKGLQSLINASGNPYGLKSTTENYPTTGDMLTYSWQIAAGRPAFATELRPPSDAPEELWFSQLPEGQIEPTFKENLNAALAVINYAGFDAPAGSVTIPWTPDTQVGQVVRNCWKVFEGFPK
jgi:carboxypeptidase T